MDKLNATIRLALLTVRCTMYVSNEFGVIFLCIWQFDNVIRPPHDIHQCDQRTYQQRQTIAYLRIYGGNTVFIYLLFYFICTRCTRILLF